MKRAFIIILSLVIGFVIAMILMSIFIYFGYSSAYNTGVEQYTVKLFGISIYKLTRFETEYLGEAIGPNMGIICVICMAVSFVTEELIRRLCHNK